MTKCLLATFGVILFAAQAQAGEGAQFKTDLDKMSYGVGMDLARNLKKHEIPVSQEFLVQGLADGLNGQASQMPEKELRRAVKTFQAEVRRNMMLAQKSAAETNKRRGESFLAENKTREGVVSLDSGVQYRVLKMGDGRKPGEVDKVDCLYRGTLLDGTEFDKTEAGKPATLQVNQLIAGWKEAIKLMPEGSHWQLFIPPQRAYGERGVGTDIGPNETLVFDVEVLAVK